MKIRDILMYLTAFPGIILLGYVRVEFTKRAQKDPAHADAYTDREKKLRTIAIALIVIGLALAFIPAKYAF